MADNKPLPIQSGPKSRQITVPMPGHLKAQLPKSILSDGYNMRQKSKWVTEAIESLLSNPEWEGVLLSEVSIKPDTKDVFRIPAELVVRINQEAARISLENPSLRANLSSIVRAAINRRLMGFFHPVR